MCGHQGHSLGDDVGGGGDSDGENNDDDDDDDDADDTTVYDQPFRLNLSPETVGPINRFG